MDRQKAIDIMREKGNGLLVSTHVNKFNDDIITFYYNLPLPTIKANPYNLSVPLLSKDVSFCVNIAHLTESEFEYLVNDLLVTVRAVKWSIEYKKALNSIYGNKIYQDTDSLNKQYGIKFFDNSEYCYSKLPYSESFSIDNYIEETTKNLADNFNLKFNIYSSQGDDMIQIRLRYKIENDLGISHKVRDVYFKTDKLIKLNEPKMFIYIQLLRAVEEVKGVRL